MRFHQSPWFIVYATVTAGLFALLDGYLCVSDLARGEFGFRTFGRASWTILMVVVTITFARRWRTFGKRSDRR